MPDNYNGPFLAFMSRERQRVAGVPEAVYSLAGMGGDAILRYQSGHTTSTRLGV